MYRPLEYFIGTRYGLARHGGQSVSFLSRVSTLGLTLAVAMLVLVLSVMNGFEREMRERILAMVPNAVLQEAGGMLDWQGVADAAVKHPGVVAAAPYVHVEGMLVRGNKTLGLLLYAVLPERERELSIVESFITEGSFAALSEQHNGVVISRLMADKLGVKVGASLALVLPSEQQHSATNRPQLERLEVVGIYQSDTELDNSLGYIHLELGQKVRSLGIAVQGVQLKVHDLLRAGQIAREVAYELSPYYFVRDWMATHGNLFQAIQLSRQLVMLMLFTIIAVAAFNVVTALMMVVNDKRGDIAIMQTLGMVPATIQRIFIIQGLIIGCTGTLAGAALGVLLSANITRLVGALERLIGYQFLKSEIYPVTYLPTDIRLWDVAAVCGFALLFCLLASLYPAWRATRVLPADALRYDK